MYKRQPLDLPGREHWLLPAELLLPGGSTIASPRGALLHRPAYSREAILYADLDPEQVAQARLEFDPYGFDARPDLFEARILRTPE